MGLKKKLGILNSLRFKIMITFALITALFIVTLNIYPISVIKNLMITAKEKEMLQKANSLSLSTNRMNTITQTTVAFFVERLSIDKNMRILICDKLGKVLYDNSVSDNITDKILLNPEIISALNGKDTFVNSFEDGKFESKAAVPLFRNGSIYGAVYLYDYDENISVFLKNTTSKLMAISAIISLIAIASAASFAKFLSQRVQLLVEGVRITRSGNYDEKIIIKGKDELSEIATEFNALTSKIKRNEDLRREFVSNASHELKTPLSSIKLLSDSILQSKNMSQEYVLEFLTDINAEIDRLTRLTDKLLMLTMLDTIPQSSFHTCCLADIVYRCYELLRINAKSKEVTIRMDMQDQGYIKGDPDGLYQIIFNLMENGIKYNKPKGELLVSLKKEDSMVVLQISDKGIGIPEEDLPNIFERFYRVDKARSRAAGGVGLGLSIVYNWIKTMNGTIAVESEFNNGTVFTIKFPTIDGDHI